jgi:hypothetical protein
MPLDPLLSAVVSSVISSVIGSVLEAPPPEPAMGIVRALPEAARKGRMQPPANGQVQIDGKTYALSPGAQIRNELNMIVMPTMVQVPVTVRFTTDMNGLVQRVWILSVAEARLPDQP